MDSQGILSRLATYRPRSEKLSIENFTTEILSHLINTDPKFRRCFIRHIIPDPQIAKTFISCQAKTQQGFGNGIVDLVLFNKSKKKVLIEIKLSAAETLTAVPGRGLVPQIRKYTAYREGHVAYITTNDIDAPNARAKNYLGQCFFEELYPKLKRVKLSTVGKLFLKFMEDRRMTPPEPFSHSEIQNASHAFEFASKCEELLDEVTRKLQGDFRQLFNLNDALFA